MAHLGYFRAECVQRRRWLDDEEYAELVALCQFLPGPASSQVGFGLGLLRAGSWGGVAAFVGFTLPSATLMVAFAYGAAWLASPIGDGALSGLKIVAVAIVAQAVWGMARTLTPDRSVPRSPWSRCSPACWSPARSVSSPRSFSARSVDCSSLALLPRPGRPRFASQFDQPPASRAWPCSSLC